MLLPTLLLIAWPSRPRRGPVCFRSWEVSVWEHNKSCKLMLYVCMCWRRLVCKLFMNCSLNTQWWWKSRCTKLRVKWLRGDRKVYKVCYNSCSHLTECHCYYFTTTCIAFISSKIINNNFVEDWLSHRAPGWQKKGFSVDQLWGNNFCRLQSLGSKSSIRKYDSTSHVRMVPKKHGGSNGCITHYTATMYM